MKQSGVLEEISIENSLMLWIRFREPPNVNLRSAGWNDCRRQHKIVAALERIREGTYGACMECEAEIGIKRLRAVPWAEYCLECQTIADRNAMTATETPLTRFAGGSVDLE